MKEKNVFKKKWENFWYYYKIHVLVVIFILICAAVFINDKIQQIQYDYTIAVLSDAPCMTEDLTKLQEGWESIADDRNQDGKVHVEVLNYALGKSGGANPQINAANQTKFIADLQTGGSMIFLYSDTIHQTYKEDNMFQVEGGSPIKVSDCSGYQNMDGISAFQNMYISLRSYKGSGIEGKKGMDEYYAGSEKLYQRFKEDK